MALRSTDWTAIRWYMDQNDYIMRDLMAGPIVRFRDIHDEIVDVNIDFIKTKYKNRLRKTSAKQTAA